MTSFQNADLDIVELVETVVAEYHPELKECGLKVGVVVAYNPDGPGIKHGGFPVLACVRVVNARDRVTKNFDVEMLIDQRAWEDELSPEQRIALVDHELSHLARVPNTPKAIAGGELAWKTDDRGRPKIKLVKGDWMVGDGFGDVVRRHGDNAVEYVNIKRAMLYADAAKNAAAKDDEAGEAA